MFVKYFHQTWLGSGKLDSFYCSSCMGSRFNHVWKFFPWITIKTKTFNWRKTFSLLIFSSHHDNSISWNHCSAPLRLFPMFGNFVCFPVLTLFIMTLLSTLSFWSTPPIITMLSFQVTVAIVHTAKSSGATSLHFYVVKSYTKPLLVKCLLGKNLVFHQQYKSCRSRAQHHESILAPACEWWTSLNR